jgi:hypothetical protein
MSDVQKVVEVSGLPLTTLKHTCGDTVETLDDISGFVLQVTTYPLSNPKPTNVTACLITCETYDIKFAWNVDPTQGATGLGHILAAGNSLRLINTKQVSGFRFINKTNGENALIQVTPELAVL